MTLVDVAQIEVSGRKSGSPVTVENEISWKPGRTARAVSEDADAVDAQNLQRLGGDCQNQVDFFVGHTWEKGVAN